MEKIEILNDYLFFYYDNEIKWTRYRKGMMSLRNMQF
jgi:hypothetical protein